MSNPNDPPAPPPPYTNRNEFVAAMNDPRYAPTIGGRHNPKHDPAYRTEVLERGRGVASDPYKR